MLVLLSFCVEGFDSSVSTPLRFQPVAPQTQIAAVLKAAEVGAQFELVW